MITHVLIATKFPVACSEQWPAVPPFKKSCVLVCSDLIRAQILSWLSWAWPLIEEKWPWIK